VSGLRATLLDDLRGSAWSEGKAGGGAGKGDVIPMRHRAGQTAPDMLPGPWRADEPDDLDDDDLDEDQDESEDIEDESEDAWGDRDDAPPPWEVADSRRLDADSD
jgi:hypothetical protein